MLSSPASLVSRPVLRAKTRFSVYSSFSFLKALEAGLVVAAGDEGAGAPVEDIVLAGAGVEPQISGLGLHHLLELQGPVGLGGLSAQGVDEGGVRGIGVPEDPLHLLVELIDIEAGNAGHHKRAHNRHQGGNEQEHNQDQLHMQAAEHGGSFLCAAARRKG